MLWHWVREKQPQSDTACWNSMIGFVHNNLETNRAKAELEATALEIAFAYCFLISLQEKPIQSQAELEATAPVTAFAYCFVISLH